MFSGYTKEESHATKRWISGRCTSLTISLSLHFPFIQGPKSTPLPRKTKSVVARHVPEGQSGLAEARDALKMALNESWSYIGVTAVVRAFQRIHPWKKLTPKWRFGRCFPFSREVFSGSLFIFRGVSSFLVLEAVLTKTAVNSLERCLSFPIPWLPAGIWKKK